MRSFFLVAALLFAFQNCQTHAQSRADSLIVAKAEENLKKQYYDARKGEILLFVGSDYAGYEGVGDEHPFFLENDWLQGTIEYNGNIYSNVPLQYDISTQKLLTEHATSGKRIQLVTESVKTFSIGNQHHFQNLMEVETKGRLDPGFYQILAEGKARLLARRAKSLQESTVTGKLEARFEESVKYYVFKDNNFYQVKGKASVLKVFEDKKRLLASGLKQNRISFSHDRESALAKTVLLYNTLSE
jgi:hypothetical protein